MSGASIGRPYVHNQGIRSCNITAWQGRHFNTVIVVPFVRTFRTEPLSHCLTESLLTKNILWKFTSGFEHNCVPGADTPEQEISVVPRIKPFSVVTLFHKHTQTDFGAKYRMKLSRIQFLCSSRIPAGLPVAGNGK
ncbi:hypothetical protein AVEN_198487-1 [Araneus ventricosus]|uniref:Uncharacterized protein n=1 Tax=Araneus ventricosus TaxID=182803 RepID=A0A4Y2W0X1_ARAVE|nr:hypothetical protein AVEN_198487-1 [Araneus ventricosus]